MRPLLLLALMCLSPAAMAAEFPPEFRGNYLTATRDYDPKACVAKDVPGSESMLMISAKELSYYEKSCSIVSATKPKKPVEPVRYKLKCSGEGEKSVEEISLQELQVYGRDMTVMINRDAKSGSVYVSLHEKCK